MGFNKILVVDDEEDIRTTLSLFLESKCEEVLDADGVAQTIYHLNRAIPDIIFLDVMLPGLDGIEILQMIKKYDENVPVIMMSGYATEEMAKKSLSIGAYDYVRKPFNLDRISSMLSVIELANFA
ncbi:MAG: response regulator [Candidatus Marinimicrobia bacterium]|nr:response regulator [Candidatus Neomarinimicrobiota bacterium]MCH7619389.1 response regulator [Candidatus Neomarinimicrobiota bacterium]MCH8287816.1 response regulator [Candidatus Neomarinimicrobiota bacterium]